MRFFNNLYPEIAEQETLLIRMENDQLPNGDYAFLEYFCDNLACRCTIVTLDVVSLDDNVPRNSKQIAAIDYEWEQPISKNNPSLHKEGKQSDLAKSALAVFKHLLKHNECISERIKKHFEMVRKYIRYEKKSSFKNNISVNKIKRNDLCPCGSNKKYKKCCLEN